MSKQFVLAFFALLFFHQLAFAQDASFTVKHNDKNIGSINVSRGVKNNIEYFSVDSKVSYRMIIKINRHTTMSATYKGGVLLSGSSEIIVNDSVDKKSITTFTNGGYEVEVNGNFYKKLEKKSIRFSIPKLYFSEPRGIEEVYSEYFMKMIPLEALGESKYVLQLDGNDENTYHYINGVLSKIEVSRTGFNLVFVRD